MRNTNKAQIIGPTFMWPNPKVPFDADSELAAWVKRTVKSMDPRLPEEDERFQVAALLVTSYFVGPVEERIGAALDLPFHRAAFWAQNLRQGRVWARARVCQSWLDNEKGRANFSADMLVSMGRLGRRERPGGKGPEYRGKPGAGSDVE